MDKNKKILITRIVLIILIILWAILVFGMSNQQGEASSGLSRKITALFLKTEEQIALVEPYVRKVAHFSEYAIGGILFLNLFLTYEWSDKRRIITSVLLGIWYAIFHSISAFCNAGFDLLGKNSIMQYSGDWLVCLTLML